MLATEIKQNELLKAINQQKRESCVIFCARLNQLATHIRKSELTASEIAMLLDGEAESIQAQQRGDHQ